MVQSLKLKNVSAKSTFDWRPQLRHVFAPAERSAAEPSAGPELEGVVSWNDAGCSPEVDAPPSNVFTGSMHFLDSPGSGSDVKSDVKPDVKLVESDGETCESEEAEAPAAPSLTRFVSVEDERAFISGAAQVDNFPVTPTPPSLTPVVSPLLSASVPPVAKAAPVAPSSPRTRLAGPRREGPAPSASSGPAPPAPFQLNQFDKGLLMNGGMFSPAAQMHNMQMNQQVQQPNVQLQMLHGGASFSAQALPQEMFQGGPSDAGNNSAGQFQQMNNSMNSGFNQNGFQQMNNGMPMGYPQIQQMQQMQQMQMQQMQQFGYQQTQQTQPIPTQHAQGSVGAMSSQVDGSGNAGQNMYRYLQNEFGNGQNGFGNGQNEFAMQNGAQNVQQGYGQSDFAMQNGAQNGQQGYGGNKGGYLWPLANDGSNEWGSRQGDPRRQRKRREPVALQSGGKVFVGGLAPHTTSTALRAYFSQFGEVVDAAVLTDVEKRSRGFAFVDFAHAIPEGVLSKDHVIEQRRCGVREYSY